MNGVRIRYPARTANAMILAGILGTGVAGVNKVYHDGTKELANVRCEMGHKTGKPQNSRDVLYEHANLRTDIYRGNIPLYFIGIHGIEAGMKEHNMGRHSAPKVK